MAEQSSHPEIKHIHYRLNEVHDDLKGMRKDLLGNGTGTVGRIGEIEKKVWSLEQWQTEREKLETVIEDGFKAMKAELNSALQQSQEDTGANQSDTGGVVAHSTYVSSITKITLACLGLVGSALLIIKAFVENSP